MTFKFARCGIVMCFFTEELIREMLVVAILKDETRRSRARARERARARTLKFSARVRRSVLLIPLRVKRLEV